MKVIRNCFLAARLMFQYAPWNALLLISGYIIPGFFMGLQILLVQNVVDSGIAYVNTGQQLDALIRAGLLLVIMLFFWTVLQELLGTYECKALEANMTRKMAPDIMKKLNSLEYSAFEAEETQGILQRVSGGPWNHIVNCFIYTFIFVQNMVSIFFTLGVYMSISVWIGIGLFLIAVPMFAMKYIATKYMQKIRFGTTGEERRLRDLKQLLQNRHAMYEMKLFESQELIAEKWREACSKVEAETKKVGGRMISLESGIGLLSILYYIFIIITLAYSLMHHTVTLGQFIAALGSIGAITGKLNATSWQMSETIRLSLEIDFYRDFMNLPERKEGTVKSIPHGDIAFENVSFSYPGTEKEVLKNVTFRIKAGEKVAFVGENGAGKSTIIKLICGLYRPDRGRVLIGGTEVEKLSDDLRRKMVSAVFQDFQGYELTLRENIAVGNITKLKADPEITEALVLADGQALLRPEEGGLNCILGHLEEGGRDLSKGQWQKVAIARAFLADAAFCILDEPTASLDPIAESHMYENFARVFHKNGTIMISHRLASAKMADRIMVLDGGRIVQNGSHEALMKEEGLYRSMYLAQSSWYNSPETNLSAQDFCAQTKGVS